MMALAQGASRGTWMDASGTSSEPLWARAARILEPRALPMPLARFWAQVAALGWAAQGHDPVACGERLRAALSPSELLSMRQRFALCDGQLARAIAFWELKAEEQLGLPSALQGELRAHVIGQGEIPFGLAVQGPWRVKHRADRDDFLEGFARSFEAALQGYPAAVLEAALQDAGP